MDVDEWYDRLWTNQDLYETKSNSDMTIQFSDGTEMPGHRDVLSYECDFFKNALKPGTFKESYTGIVSLPNDPPQAAKALIEFLYVYDYTFPLDLNTEDAIFFHLDVLDIGQLYLVEELCKLAEYNIGDLIVTKMADISIPVLIKLMSWLRSTFSHVLSMAARHHMETLVTKDVWNKLRGQAPHFIQPLREDCEYEWKVKKCPRSGMLLDHLGGEHSVGMARHKLRCPRCGCTDAKVVGLVRPERFEYQCCYCRRESPSNRWIDLTEYWSRIKPKQKKQMRKSKKQEKKNKARKKSAKKRLAKKKNSRG